MIESRPWGPNSSCILELRARVEALEAPQFRSWHPQGGKGHLKIAVETTYGTSLTPSPAGSLVKRVGNAINNAPSGRYEDRDTQARAAIREVAEWLRQRDTRVMPSVQIAGDLEQEATR